ncbi:MAG TPA: acetyl-CoA carboxylase biotin carboxyl carrier protein [Saprospiraceae bacterium]|nr:acetyl-CoA carboxylase biotin carboxyl carrier protein [Saprospiraceae bacterium]
MTHKEIQDLIKLIGKTDLAELKIKDGEFELLLRTNEYFKNKKSPVTQMQPQSQTFIPMPGASATPGASDSSHTPSADQSTDKKPEASSATSQEENQESNENLLEVKSPIVGTFYRSPSPDKAPYIKVGDSIEKGDVVCIVEAMKLFNEIESEVSGTIVQVMVEDASPVEYDQVLFMVEPS